MPAVLEQEFATIDQVLKAYRASGMEPLPFEAGDSPLFGVFKDTDGTLVFVFAFSYLREPLEITMRALELCSKAAQSLSDWAHDHPEYMVPGQRARADLAGNLNGPVRVLMGVM